MADSAERTVEPTTESINVVCVTQEPISVDTSMPCVYPSTVVCPPYTGPGIGTNDSYVQQILADKDYCEAKLQQLEKERDELERKLEREKRERQTLQFKYTQVS